MSGLNWRFISVWLQVQLSKLNALHLVVCGLLLAAFLAGGVLLPIRQHQIQAKQEALAQARAAFKLAPTQAKTAASESESHLQALRAVLGDGKRLELPVKTTLTLAEQAGLKVMQADYKFACDTKQIACAYKMQLPVIGTYGSIRRLLEHTLVKLPYASVDELLVKREDINSDELDVRLRVSFHVLASTVPAKDKQGVGP
jgi:hypothetical protein